MTHIRIEDATMAMMPIEKMPMSASRLVMGTLRLSNAGMGKSIMKTSLARLATAEKTQSLIGS